MSYLEKFRMPTPVTITGRTSSITNSFVNGIIPRISPTEEQIKKILSLLGMDDETIKCAYCGSKFTEWDHFRPLVENKMPTGYISEIDNLVPSCGKCNQSKGNKNWKEWIMGDAKLSPKTLCISNLHVIVQRLEAFSEYSNPIKLDFEEIVGKERWQGHWDNCNSLHHQMKESQKLSNEIREILKKSMGTFNKISLENNSTNKKKLVQAINSPRTLDNSDNLRAVGKIVQTDLKNILISGKLSDESIIQLQDLDYSNRKFGTNYPILKKIKLSGNILQEKKDHLGINRYYASPIIISNEEYLLTSQWYERNRDKLVVFIQLNNKLK